MKLTFAPRGILQINEARLVYRNFRGEGSKYNREGDRNFSIVIESKEMADALVERGWNVKVNTPDDPDELPFITLPVKVKFNDRGPNVYLVIGEKTVRLYEDTVKRLDEIDIICANLDIRPYNWEVNGKTGVSAYLKSIEVFQDVDRFSAKYED